VRAAVASCLQAATWHQVLADRCIRHRLDDDDDDGEQVTAAAAAASVLRTSPSACQFLRRRFSQRQLAAWLVADMSKLYNLFDYNQNYNYHK